MMKHLDHPRLICKGHRLIKRFLHTRLIRKASIECRAILVSHRKMHICLSVSDALIVCHHSKASMLGFATTVAAVVSVHKVSCKTHGAHLMKCVSYSTRFLDIP